MMDTEVIQNTLRLKQTKMKTRSDMLQSGYVWQESSFSLYHKNLTVKIVMPLQDYKAQYSVKINIYFFPSSILLHRRIRLCGTTALKSEVPPAPPLMALDLSSFISICTQKKYFSVREGAVDDNIYCNG